ncbi:hypothetical protein FOL46_001311, partial [Perkinsus olseni]
MFTLSKKVEDYVTSLVPSEHRGEPSNVLETPDISLKPPLWMDLKPEWELLDVVACEKEMALYYVRNGDTRFYAFDLSPAYVERVKFGNYRKEVRSHRKFNLASDTVRKEAINLLRDMVRVEPDENQALPRIDIDQRHHKTNVAEGLSETPNVKNYMDDCHLMYGKRIVVLPANISEINVALVNYVRRSLACAGMHLKDVKTVALSDGNVSSNGVFYATPYVISWPPSRWQAVADSVVPDDITFRQALSFLGTVHVVDNWLLPPFFVMRRNLLQSLLQTQLHADGDDWDALVPHQSVEYLREFKNAFSDAHNHDYSVFRRVIQWAPLHVFVDSSTYSYGYIAGQYLEEVSVGMDAADVSELRKILKSFKGPLQPHYDFSERLLNAVAVSVPDPVLKNVRYNLIPGSVNIADGLTRDALTESLMLALSTSSSVKTERQHQVRDIPVVNDFVLVWSDPSGD